MPAEQRWPDGTPGSDEAVAKGCSCPRIDNGHGAGVMVNGNRKFWIDHGCRLHFRRSRPSKAVTQ